MWQWLSIDLAVEMLVFQSFPKQLNPTFGSEELRQPSVQQLAPRQPTQRSGEHQQCQPRLDQDIGMSRHWQFGTGKTGRKLAEDLQQSAEDRAEHQHDHHGEQDQGRHHADQDKREPK